MERASPGGASLLWRQTKIWRENCGALSVCWLGYGKKTRPCQPGSRSAELARTGPVVMLTSVHTNLDKLTGSINTLYSLTATLVGKNLIINLKKIKKEVVHAQLDTIDDDALTNISVILAEKQSISTMLRSTKNVCS